MRQRARPRPPRRGIRRTTRPPRAAIRARVPHYDLRCFGPPRARDDERFGEPSGGEIEGAVFWPNGGYVSDPQLSTHNLQRAAEAKGAEFAFRREVTSIVTEEGRVRGVALDGGETVRSPVVVNVAGPHSAIVNAMAEALDDMTIETKPLRQEVVHLPAPPGFDLEACPWVFSDSDIGCYTRPETGDHILVGSEDPECDPREYVDPDRYVRDLTEQSTTQALRYGQRLPSLGIPSSVRGVADLYVVTDDWIPIYDKSRVPGFYMAIGSSGNQFKNAPVAGKMMAALIDYCERGNDHDVDPLSFRLEHIGREVNAGFYSRKREINLESSFTVLG